MVADEPASSGLEHLGVVPRTGSLVPLKTKDEVRAALETFEAYILEVPARWAGAVKDAIQEAIPDLKTSDFQHLRRVVQFKYLPLHIQRRYRPPHPSRPRGDGSEEDSEVTEAEDDDTARYFLVSPTTAIEHATLIKVLVQKTPFGDAARPPWALTISVPALSPTSAEQAAQWSLEYWPVAYKNTNPYGPHSSLLARNGLELAPDAGTMLALADAAGKHVHDMGFGEQIGCVIVDRTAGVNEIVAVAGDARWRSPCGEPTSHNDPGNVMAHAVQRAIAIVGKKRLRVAGSDPDSVPSPAPFCDTPVTDLEKRFHTNTNIPPNGYLCVDLDIYITHEPCVMCSMAILHSRFRRCIFGKRMPLTGGLTADTALQKPKGDAVAGTGLGHGIFWRPSELNWKFLAWEWLDTDATTMITNNTDTLQA
ncbi:hypothetical protein BDV96DRAFT_515610 [Lophiotrema nucula]|uniref:CMP/dCMP-type deaminase domain-containing protein n=1 Tax=Lophiotrema nucula TaxID=690887 RepID=A0A6A5ZIW6_9PLEO|nr:hypothetical protein BDV96DRAFT_515610 [Lophiotrema nucula]